MPPVLRLTTAVSSGATGLSLTLDETVAIVVAALLVGVGTWSIKKNHEMREYNKAMGLDVHDIKVALIGEIATALNPLPKPGLIAVVGEHSVLLKELVADKKPNSGSTTRDAIDRIEERVGSAPSASDAQHTVAHKKAS